MRRPCRSRQRRSLFLILLLAVGGAPALGYPLDGYAETGIRRLKAYQMLLQRQLAGNLNLPPGALMNTDQIQLLLADKGSDFQLSAQTPRDPALQRGLERLLDRRDDSYRIALIDLTDPSRPRYAGVRETSGYTPGSVAKLLVMAAMFAQVKERFPNDFAARAHFLKTIEVTADSWVLPNSHAVPIVSEGFSSVTHRAIRVGDRFSLWEWLDHMVSPSSNAAASIVWREAMLMRVLRGEYPGSPEQRDGYLKSARLQLSDDAAAVIEGPLVAAGLDPESLRVRTFFTRTASNIVPGRSSQSTPRELLRWLIRLEQGQLVDRWSSLQMKRLLYFTRRRYRYAASPALNTSALYFKSGSLYRCQAEEGYECGQYRGNLENLMHSVAIVEGPMEEKGSIHYMISVMSNVLKVNSAQAHLELASEIDRLVRAGH